jgi:hypothetical protein
MALDFVPHDLSSSESHSPFKITGSSWSGYGPIYRALDGSAGGSNYWLGDCAALGVGAVEWLTVNLDNVNGIKELNYSGASFSASSAYGGGYGASEVANESITYWLGTSGGVEWVKCDWGSGVTHIIDRYSVQVNFGSSQPSAPKDWTLEGSNDNSTWNVVDTVTGQTSWGPGEERAFACDVTTTAYRYYRLNITAVQSGAYTQIKTWRMFKAAAGTPIRHTCVSYDIATASGGQNSAPKDWKLQGSNDYVTWADLDTVTNETGWSSGGETRSYTCDTATAAYQFFRVRITANNSDATYTSIAELYLWAPLADFAPHDLTSATSHSPFAVNASSDNAYGYKHKAFNGTTDYWLGDSGSGVDWLELNLDTTKGVNRVASAAQANSSSYGGGYTAAQTVDDDQDTFWIGTGNGVDWLSYDFGSGSSNIFTKYSIQVNKVPEATRAPKDWTLEGSDDTTTWTVVDTVTNQTSWGSGERRWFTCDSATTGYRYYRINITANNGAATYTQICQANFYINAGASPITKKLHSYSVKVNSVPEASRAPNTWKMQGSNDAETWTDLDTVSGQASWGSGELRYFQCDTYTTEYQYFRINITANNGDGTYVQIQELYLYEDTRRELVGTAGIGSAEAFGSGGEVSVASTGQDLTGEVGITSAEAFSAGTFIWDLFVTGSAGIASEEAFSAGSLAFSSPIVGVDGIASEETFGVGTFDLIIVGGSGITSAEVFSAGIIAGAIKGEVGIASEEAFSDGIIENNVVYALAGIASEEAFGVGSFGYEGGPVEGLVGIASAEAFGVGVISGPIVGVDGIASAEAFGVGELLSKIIGISGIETGEQFGSGGTVTRSAAGLEGIVSEEAFGKTGALLTFSPGLDNAAPSNFVVYVGSSLWTEYVQADSIKIERQVNYQSSAALTLIDSDQLIWPRRGDEVIIYHYDEDLSPEKPGDNNWHRIFAGTIETMEINGDWVGDTTRFINVNCTDYGRGLSKRLLYKTFDEATYGTLTKIMEYLNSTILKEEGLTWVSKGDPGIVIGDIEFDYTPMNEVLDKLSEIVGWTWLTDYYRNLYIYDKPTEQVSAPFDLTEDTTGANAYMWRNLKVTHSRGLFRNRQYVRSITAAGEDGGVITPPNADPDPDDVPLTVLKKTYTVGTWKVSPEALISLRRNAWDTSPIYYQDELRYVPNPAGGWHFITVSGLKTTDKVSNHMAVNGVIAATQEDMEFFGSNPPIEFAPRIVDDSPYAADGYDISSPWYRGGYVTSLKVNGVSKTVTGLDGRNPSTGLFDVDWMCPMNTGYTTPTNGLHYFQWMGTQFEAGSNGGQSLVCYYIGRIIDPLNESKVHIKYGDSIEITWTSYGGTVPETYTHTYVIDVPRDVDGYPDAYLQDTVEAGAGNPLRFQGQEERIGRRTGAYKQFLTGAVIYDEALEGIVKGVQSVKRNGVEEVVNKSYYQGVLPVANAEWLWAVGVPKIVGRHIWQNNFWRNNIGKYINQANVSMVGEDIEYPLSARVDKQPVWGDIIEVEWLVPATTQPPAEPVEVPPDDPVDPGDDPIAIPTIGIWEAVDDLPGVTDPVLVRRFAQSLLNKYSVPGVEVEFETFRFGWEPGQETTITLRKYGVYNMTAKVESITYTEDSMRVLKQNVKISNSIQGRDALNAFNRLLKKLNQPNKAQKSTITFHLAETIPGIPNPGLITGTEMGAAFIARRNITLIDGVVYFKTAPTGAPIQMDIKVDGVSIFPVGHGVVYPADSTALKAFSLFRTNPLTIKKNSRVTIDVISTGSEQPGKDGTLVLSGWV